MYDELLKRKTICNTIQVLSFTDNTLKTYVCTMYPYFQLCRIYLSLRKHNSEPTYVHLKLLSPPLPLFFEINNRKITIYSTHINAFIGPFNFYNLTCF